MRRVLVPLILFGLHPVDGLAGSDLLNSVKNNPAEAKSLCRSFRSMNKKGKSAFSNKSIKKVANSRGLKFQDSEVLVTYVVGMHCPDVQ